MKQLEGIGVITKEERKKASGQSSNYQEAVTVPLTHDYDEDAIGNDDKLLKEIDIELSGRAVNELQSIVCAVRVSPQHQKAWKSNVGVYIQMDQPKTTLQQTVLMLILNVKTWWSSTHQMLHKFYKLIF
ncbi:hypothetical protein H0H81_003024 [Sphagnurus paluster]|uniref:Uncharacterized protein n=1 Tax=Sphagnurus paluster TaxID=117069 RepID=A0A9P7GJC5_9AGAR|nr:hypothetical protein H0H81_003024 [Sphagnurus paluster]